MLHDTPGALEASRLHGVRGALYQQCMNTCRGEITQSRLGFSICKAAALSQDAQCLRLCLARPALGSDGNYGGERQERHE